MEVAARSDIGLIRHVNEDYVLVDAEIGLVVVADGAGGLITGILAARLAAEGVCELLRTSHGDLEQRARDALRAISRVVHDAVESKGASLAALTAISNRLDEPATEIVAMARAGRCPLEGMHAALAIALVVDDRIVIAHVGDCRVYRITADAAIALTVDHTFPGLNVVTRAIGMVDVDPEVQVVRLLAGERLLLCSDGLHDTVDDAAIAALAHHGSIEHAVDALVDLAMTTSRDNIAVALLDPRGEARVVCRNGAAYPSR